MTRDYETDKTIPIETLAGLGDGEIAYVRPITSDEVSELFPQVVPNLAPGLNLWALLGADGTPIMLADSRETAEVTAMQNDLHTVSVH